MGYGDPHRGVQVDLGNVLVDEFYLVFLNGETSLSLCAFGNETFLVHRYEVKKYERRFCGSLALRRDFGSLVLPLRIHAPPSTPSSRSSCSPTIRSSNPLVPVRWHRESFRWCPGFLRISTPSCWSHEYSPVSIHLQHTYPPSSASYGFIRMNAQTIMNRTRLLG